jgi:hypothetical protein
MFVCTMRTKYDDVLLISPSCLLTIFLFFFLLPCQVRSVHREVEAEAAAAEAAELRPVRAAEAPANLAENK